MKFDPQSFVPWIRSAAPYIHALRGRTIVIAFGGEVVADETFLGIVHDLNLLHSLGLRLVVVHGARPQIEAILKQQNIPSRYHKGLRITDVETMDCVLEGMGHARSRIEALLSLGIANSPMAGARIRVVGGNFITAKPIGILDGIHMELTGEVRRVDIEGLRQRLDDGDLVLVSPLGYSPTGEIFNLALEEVATQVAVHLTAYKLIFLMETEGVRNGRRQLLTELSIRRGLVAAVPGSVAYCSTSRLLGTRERTAGIRRPRRQETLQPFPCDATCNADLIL